MSLSKFATGSKASGRVQAMLCGTEGTGLLLPDPESVTRNTDNNARLSIKI